MASAWKVVGRPSLCLSVVLEAEGGLDAPAGQFFLTVEALRDEASYVAPLEEYGFELVLREPGWHEHRLLRRVAPATNLHVLAVGSAEAQRILLSRDRLRSKEAGRVQYELVKRALAAHTWDYVQDYADAKSGGVEQTSPERRGKGRQGVSPRHMRRRERTLVTPPNPRKGGGTSDHTDEPRSAHGRNYTDRD